LVTVEAADAAPIAPGPSGLTEEFAAVAVAPVAGDFGDVAALGATASGPGAEGLAADDADRAGADAPDGTVWDAGWAAVLASDVGSAADGED
jgi:hypothetical protein